ncbi:MULTISPECIES: hypothetical protein [unclassified Streptomyces]|uniref:hypothetical protein n=1 Tax=unclassified Streptomyces TaxID=2593676 RepID=UPI003FA36F6C
MDQRLAPQRLPEEQGEDGGVHPRGEQRQAPPHPVVGEAGEARCEGGECHDQQRQEWQRVHAEEVRDPQIAAGRRPTGQRH